MSNAANAQLDQPSISKGITVSNETTDGKRDIYSLGLGKVAVRPVPVSPTSHSSSPERRYPTRQRNPSNRLNL